MSSVFDAWLAREACTVNGTAGESCQPLKYAAMQRDETRCVSVRCASREAEYVLRSIFYSLDGRRLMLISFKAAVAVVTREILVVIFEMALANFEHHARNYSVFFVSQ